MEFKEHRQEHIPKTIHELDSPEDASGRGILQQEGTTT